MSIGHCGMPFLPMLILSPFTSANKIKKPLLFIHGEEDNNPGTLTMHKESCVFAACHTFKSFIFNWKNSDRFLNTLKGHGALCRLVILPFESHGYAARESAMHVLWEMDRWLQEYCVANSSEASEDQKASEENASSTTDTRERAVSAAGRVP